MCEVRAYGQKTKHTGCSQKNLKKTVHSDGESRRERKVGVGSGVFAGVFVCVRKSETKIECTEN